MIRELATIESRVVSTVIASVSVLIKFGILNKAITIGDRKADIVEASDIKRAVNSININMQIIISPAL